MNLPDGVACVHRACLSHKTFPCPFCGRIAGRALTHSERIAKAAMKALDMPLEEAWFQDCVKAIEPLVLDARVVGPIHRRRVTLQRPWLVMSLAHVDPWYRDVMKLPKAIWSVLNALRHVVIDVLNGWRYFDRQIAEALQIHPTLLGLPVYVASSKREEQERKDHYWKTVIMPRLREYLKENHGNE